jgi:hypothetical protein
MKACEGCTSRNFRQPRNKTVGFRNVVIMSTAKELYQFNNMLNILQSYVTAQN